MVTVVSKTMKCFTLNLLSLLHHQKVVQSIVMSISVYMTVTYISQKPHGQTSPMLLRQVSNAAFYQITFNTC